MQNNGYVTLDTRKFDAFDQKTPELIQAYDELNSEYDRIVSTLLNNWKGRGATAFQKDASTVKTNIVGIFDILKTMCDMLKDCKEDFAECDRSLGEDNRKAKIES